MPSSAAEEDVGEERSSELEGYDQEHVQESAEDDAGEDATWGKR